MSLTGDENHSEEDECIQGRIRQKDNSIRFRLEIKWQVTYKTNYLESRLNCFRDPRKISLIGQK